MPPKRRSAAAPRPSPSSKYNKQQLKPPRASKLARENDISGEQEAEIHEAFALFAEQHPDYADQKDGVLRMADVRRCLIALNLLPPRDQLQQLLSALDPERTGFATYSSFVALCAIQIHSGAGSGSGSGSGSSSPLDDANDDEYDEDEENKAGNYNASSHRSGPSSKSKSSRAEVMTAYKLFTHNSSGPITIAHLRRVARELREEVDDKFLADMINEANGGEGAGKGVGLSEFESVMRRAGVLK